MKKNLCISTIFLLLNLLSTSCLNKGENSENQSYLQAELILEMIYPYPDKFLVYYTTDINAVIDGSTVIEKKVYGTNEMQKIVFKFPKGDFPRIIRLDVGKNQKAERIIIKNISIRYGEKNIDGDDGEFMKSWSPNNCLIYNEENFGYEIVPNEGKKEPVFMSNIKIQEELSAFFR
jgi:hypothetical protein